MSWSLLTGIGTVGYMRLEGFSLGEAIFMTVTVMSTVGLQPRPLGAGGQALTIVLVVLGLGVVLYTVGLGHAAGDRRRVSSALREATHGTE